MDNTKVQESAKETLARVREESINLGISVYSDFVGLAHNDFENYEIDFSNYGYLEYCLFAECLNLFNNYGYDSLTQIIDELEEE